MVRAVSLLVHGAGIEKLALRVGTVLSPKFDEIIPGVMALPSTILR
ncbi:MAG: hypothetical protein CM1200mP9_03410 [Gammaproteobacteria bacterium]|nr:MAG: hypothetical protein CM1200mP9_03410 [Gammaproteobacteria bacterium]